MEKKFSEQDSLRVINEMIAQVNSNIQIGSASSMIRNGYLVATIAILNIILIHTMSSPQYSFWIWALMIPASIIGHLIDRNKDKQAIVKTYMDRIINNTWHAFGFSIIILLVIIFGMVFIFNTWVFTILFNPIILTLTGLAQYVTAVTTKFRPFLWGAVVLWTGALFSMVLLPLFGKTVEIQFVMLAVCMILGFCVPGHKLNNKAKQNV